MIMDKSVLYTVIITFLATVLICGLLLFLFAGSLNFFGTQGFHGNIEYFIEGVILGSVFIAPVITTIVLLIRGYKRYALIAGIIAALLWFMGAVVVPFIVTKREQARDSAPPRDIAARAIARIEKEERELVSDSAKYAERLGNQLWIFEGTSTRLDAAKEKEVAECAAQLLIENLKLKEPFTEYKWVKRKYAYNSYDIELLVFYQDGSSVVLYEMDYERWKELNLPDPPLK